MNREGTVACISVVIPVFNEEATLAAVVHKLIDVVPGLLEIIIVNDCSADDTAEIANELAKSHKEVQVAHHSRNAGIALTHGDIVIVQDADLEYDPKEIWELVEPILDGRADVVFGSRFLVRKAARVLYFSHYLANKVLTFISNLLTNLNMTDLETGYKAFRGEIIRNMIITSRGFGCEVEMTAKVAKLKCAIYEVPISYYGRTYEQGKKIGVTDGIAALWYILRFNLLCNLRASFRSPPSPQSLVRQPPAAAAR